MYRAGVIEVFSVTFAAVSLSVVGATSAIAGGLIPHRAVYDIELKQADEQSGIDGMNGRLVYEFGGDKCTGYTTNFRFVTRLETGDQVRVTDQQSTTFENPDAGEFRFDSKSFTDDQLDKEVSGFASGIESGIRIDLDEPESRSVDIASSRFPTEHMLEVIDKARKGKSVVEERIFDGSEDGDQSYLTTTFVGNSQKPKDNDPEIGADSPLAKSPYWPVSIAYFNDGDSGDQLPVYTQSFKLYENGITRDLTLDYGDFVLSGHLKKLEILGDGKCQ